MADSNTTNYSFVMPEVGASQDTWGEKLNDNWADVDGLLGGDEPVLGIDINSGSIDGAAIGGDTPATGSFSEVRSSGDVLINNEGADSVLRLNDGATSVWSIRKDVSNGNDLEVLSYDGASNGNVIFNISGGVGIGKIPTVPLDVSGAGALSGSLDVGGSITASGSVNVSGSVTASSFQGNATTATALDNTSMTNAGISGVDGLANVTEARGGTDDALLMSAARVLTAINWRCSGRNQTWSDKTSSRSANTWYYNDEERPITVNIVASIDDDADFKVSTSASGGVTVARGLNGDRSNMSALVPPGHYYKIEGTFSVWAELR